MQGSRYYILVGDRRTWEVSLENRIWGFSDATKGLWNTSSPGDLIAFYVTAPLKKIVGFGVFGIKFIDDSMLWPDEKLFERTIWKYRIKIMPVFIVDNWRNGIKTPHNLMLNTGRKVVPQMMFFSLVGAAEKQWNADIHGQLKYK